MKRLLSWLLVLALTLSCLPLSAFAQVDPGDFDPDIECDMWELGVGGSEYSPLDLTNDLINEGDYCATVTIPAGKTLYCIAFRVGGTEMTINDGEPVACSGDFRTPYAWSITNDGQTEATYTIKVFCPLGSWTNPAQLVSGENTVTLSAGSYDYYYTYIAEKTGTLVLEFSSDVGGWSYIINNLTSYAYGNPQYSNSYPLMNPAQIEVAEGDELQIMVNTYDPADEFNTPAGTVIINVDDHFYHVGDIWVTIEDASCTADGMKARICDVCGETEVVTIPAYGHSHQTVVTAPTCTEQGYTTITCTVCGETTVTDYTEAGHSGGVWFEIIAPTCTETGLNARICDACGETETVELPALGHSYKSVITAPTCTEKGYTTNTCTVCGDVTVTDHTAPVGHSYESVVTAPTCTEQGYTTITCTLCGNTEITDYVDAKGHTWSAWIQTKAPTCAAEGSRLRFCNCGTRETKAIPTLEHTWGQWTQTQAPTCTEEGINTRTCACGASETEAIPMLAHTYEDSFCTICGAYELEIVASGKCGDNVHWILDTKGTLVIYGTGAMTNYSFYNAPWCSNSTSVNTAVIRNGVTSIGSSAFEGCQYMNSVTIPDSVTSIGDDAFSECSNLKSINIPDSVISIGNGVFCLCESLTSVTIPAGVTTIDDYAFSQCFALTSINIPDSVTSIGDYAISYCESLSAITIPDGVTSIGEYAFEGCTSLITVTYCGTDAEWNNIAIGSENFALTSATRYYHNWNEAACTTDKICVICGEVDGQWPHFYENGLCVSCGILESSNWTLTENVTVELSLTEDFYIDLNGFDLSGTIHTNGYRVFGMDSATNAYTCDWMGYFSCVDENGNVIVPEGFYTTEDMKRYMAIETEAGYTFHRFYVGITHLSLDTNVTGFGYKAEFYGDEMVQDQIDSIGYNLWLTEDRVISRTTAFKNIVTLRLKNFDVINYGETPVNACVTLTLTDGFVIESATASYSMRQMVEQINDSTQNYQRATLQNVALMVLNNQPMETWQVANILASLRPEASVSEITVVNADMKLYDAWGNPSGNETFTLDAAYIFDAQDTTAVAMAGPYAKWLADYYITIDGVVHDGLYLAGNYEGWGWISYEVPAGAQYQDYGLLTNSIGAITYTEVVRDVNRFSCGFADTLNANAGATITVQLRLTNPDNPNDTITIQTIQILLEAETPDEDATPIAAPEKVAGPSGDALLIVKSNNSDWTVGVPALEGTQIKYYNKTSKAYETLSLSTLVPSSTGKQNGTNNFWEYADASGNFTLKVTCGYIHESKCVYGMPVVVNNSGNKMYFTISSTNGYVSANTTYRTVTLTYDFTDGYGQTLTFSNTWISVREDMISAGAKQYIYSDFVNGILEDASSSNPCFAPNTLITMADGTQKQVRYVSAEELILVWDFVNGEYAVVPAGYVMNHGYGNYTVVALQFADGTQVKTINGHGFFDVNINEYAIINAANVESYVGHDFMKQSGDGFEKVALVGYEVYQEYTESWSVLSYMHYNCFIEGMLSITPHEAEGNFFMPFAVGHNMMFDQAMMEADIAKYGLYTYEEFADIMSEELFEALSMPYVKVAVGKGITSEEDIWFLLNLHFGIER